MDRNAYKEHVQDGKLTRDVMDLALVSVRNVLPADLCVTSGLTDLQVEEIESEILYYVLGDLTAVVKRDPAAKGSHKRVLETSSAFRAVLCYRIASTIHHYIGLNQEVREWRAKQISEDAKVKTAIEIPPAARIGERFVIDHGTGTVIGADCIIGCDCYMLQEVVLGVREFGGTSGSEEITDNISGRRHPTIGSNVHIAAFAKIFGPIAVGDNVQISPHCVITHDIPSNCKVVIVNQLQICRGSTCDHREIYGIVPEDDGIICIYGKGLQGSSVSLIESLDEDIQEINGIETIIKENNDDIIKLEVSIKNKILNNKIKLKPKGMEMVITKEGEEMIITKSIGLRRAIETIMKTEGGA